MSKYCLGIDLGTTYSCVSVYHNGRSEVIPNELGNRTTASYVCFTDEERLVGDSAKNQANMNPENTLFDSKRLIGRSFNDFNVQNDMKNWSFKLEKKNEEDIVYVVNYKNERKELLPEQVSAMILSYMKKSAEQYLGTEITDAVVTVPANFSNEQKQKTKLACEIAGINCKRLISEPTAAAIAYGLDNKKDKEQKVLIFDFGGGTFDISILTIDEGLIEIIGTHGDMHLGGEDIDTRIIDCCVTDIKKRFKYEIKENPKALRRLKTACERAKRSLSSGLTASIEIDCLFNTVDYNYVLTRAKFEELTNDIFRKCINIVDETLKTYKVSKESIDEIVLVGGSSKIPKVQSLLSEFFNGKVLNNSINPDEAVSVGASIQGAILSGTKGSLNDLIVLDVTPLSIGVAEGPEHRMHVMIGRGKTIPCAETTVFSNGADGQTTAKIEIFEGERKFVKDNTKLGEFEITLPPMRRGQCQVEVSVDVDVNNLITVSACTKGAEGEKKSLKITNSKRHSESDIKRMISEAEKFKEEDEKHEAVSMAKCNLLNFISSIEDNSKSTSNSTSTSNTELKEKLEQTKMWMNSPDLTVNDLENKLTELQEFYKSVKVEHSSTEQSNTEGFSTEPSVTNSNPSNKTKTTELGSGPKIEEVD